MTITKNPRTGENEMQSPEYAIVSPTKTLADRIATLESQVKSLQLTVAAIERRQMPLVQGK
jgi:hypothetical protein